MARNFKKKDSAGILVLPGYGRVQDNTILSGERFAQFCPQFLEEVSEVQPVAALIEQKPAPSAPMLTEELPAHPVEKAILEELPSKHTKKELLEELPHPDKNSEVTEKVVTYHSKKNK
jgi:hypothetical protein